MSVAQASATRSAQSGPFTQRKAVKVLTFANIAASVTADLDVAFTGCKAGDTVRVDFATGLAAGFVFSYAICTVDGTVRLRFANVTVAAINPPAPVNATISVGTAH